MLRMKRPDLNFFVAPIRQFRRMIFLDFRYDTFDISVDTRTKVLEQEQELKFLNVAATHCIIPDVESRGGENAVPYCTQNLEEQNA